MAVKRGICSHCGKAIKLDDAYKASRCPFCGNRVETWAALKLAAADAPSGASERQPSPASHAPQGQGTAPVGPDMRKGECPHCGKNLMVDARSETMMCPACRNKFKTAAAIRLASSGAPSAQPRPAANGTSAPAGRSAALASAGAEAYGGEAAVGARQTGSSSTATNPASFYEQHKKAIYIAIVIVVIIATILTVVFSLPTVGRALKGIEIVEEAIVTNPYYCAINDYVYPIVILKIKNNSLRTKKVSFEVNIYADGELLGSDQSSYVTLAAGDESYIHAQSDRGYFIAYYNAHEYTYKITRWWVS